MASHFQTRFRVRIGPNGPGKATLVSSYIWDPAFGAQYGPTGPFPLGNATSGLIDYMDDNDQHVGIIYRDENTGVTLGAEASINMDDEDKDHVVDVSIEDHLKVFWGRDGHKEDRGDWVRKPSIARLLEAVRTGEARAEMARHVRDAVEVTLYQKAEDINTLSKRQ